jgi:hypothetical protein
LWAVILFRVVSVLVENYTKQPFLGIVKRKENAWYETGEFVKWVQTAALLEVVHSLVGRFFPLVENGRKVRFVWILMTLQDLFARPS